MDVDPHHIVIAKLERTVRNRISAVETLLAAMVAAIRSPTLPSPPTIGYVIPWPL